MSYSAVIFDLDGTLVDTIDDLTAAMNAALAHFALPTHSAQHCKMMIGNGATRFAERALPTEKQDLAEKVLTLMREHYRDNCFENTRLYDGMGETVQQLRHRGLRLAMLTNKDQVVAARIIEHFFDPGTFQYVIGATQGQRIKPDPTATIGIVKSMKLSCEDFVFVGDSAVDIETARAAGMCSVGAAWGFRGRGELAAAGADIIIDSPREILDLVA